MKKVCFCGISGSGMSALAQILKLSGDEVIGTDRSFDQGHDEENKNALQSLGIKILPQDGSAISEDVDCLYVSTAVEDHIPDVKAAISKGIPIKKRSDLLAEIFHRYKNSIAVGGTSGKTTTTAMIGYILDKLGQLPCMINGGLLRNYENQPGIPNIIFNKGDICVIEADESDGSIEKYHPYIAVINNISLDHKPIPELQKIFGDFAARSEYGAVVNADCEACRDIKHPHKKTVTFSLENPRADFTAYNIKAIPGGTAYSLDSRISDRYKPFRLPLHALQWHLKDTSYYVRAPLPEYRFPFLLCSHDKSLKYSRELLWPAREPVFRNICPMLHIHTSDIQLLHTLTVQFHREPVLNPDPYEPVWHDWLLR